MISRYKKIVNAWRLYRFGIIRIAINKYFSGFICLEKFILYKYDLRNKKLLESQKREAVCIHKLKDEKDELFKKFHQKFPSKEFIKRIQDPHKTCYVALINEKVAGYGWVASKELFIDSLNYNFPLEEGEFFIFACYVPKENRGQGIYPEMLREILNDGIKRGKERAYIGVSAANAGSIRGIEKAGFEQLRTVRYLQFLSMKKWAGLEKVEA